MKIFLVGFMGSGKTAVGKRLAKSLNYAFIDLDKLIEGDTDRSINELFDEFGEEHFRKLERKALEEMKSKNQTVISTGGGTPCFSGNMDFMNDNGKTFYLHLSEDLIYQRLQDSNSRRPLIRNLSDEELVEFIEDKLRERLSIYSQAQYSINAAHITNAAEEISSIIKMDLSTEDKQ